MSSLDYLDLCRLCLVKDQVNVPIFEGEGDVRQIFLKIAACLPVKVGREDKLPKKICDDCVYKVESFYQFWNTTINAEKQLLQWIGEDGLEDKQGYVNVMKQEQNSENRFDSNVIQVTGHQNNMGIGLMDNMGLGMPIIISSTNQQQISSVPLDTTGNSVTQVQAVPGSSVHTSHEQIQQSQTSIPVHQEVEDDSSDDDNMDDECDGDEGLVKEEGDEDLNSNKNIEQTTFVNVALTCDQAGPSGLQQQKMAEMTDMGLQQSAEGDPKSGDGGTFGGLSGMLRQILSPSPENVNESTLTSYYNVLQPSIFTSHASLLTSSFQVAAPAPAGLQSVAPPSSSHYPVMCADQSGFHEHAQVYAESYLCPVCNLEFRSAVKLNYHMRTSHPRGHPDEQALHQGNSDAPYPGRFACRYCSKTFYSHGHLRVHEVTHTNPMAAYAPATTQVAPPAPQPQPPPVHSYPAATHQQHYANQDKSFSCDRCQATFRYRTLLEKHKKVHEYDADKPYSCPHCLMRFETRNQYNHHAKTHKPNNAAAQKQPPGGATGPPRYGDGGAASDAGAPAFPCDACNKTFPSADALNSHKSLHKTRPLVCDVCGKGFTHRKYYVVHQRIHTGERPYLCAMCGKSFTQASTLTVHRRYHTGERPYTCTLCGKGFVTRTIMLNHMKKH